MYDVCTLQAVVEECSALQNFTLQRVCYTWHLSYVCMIYILVDTVLQL